MRSIASITILTLVGGIQISDGFVTPTPRATAAFSRHLWMTADADSSSPSPNNNENEFESMMEDWDKDVDYEKEWSKNEESDDLYDRVQNQGEINIIPSFTGKVEIPWERLTEDDLQEINDEVAKIIDEGYAKSMEEIERLRERLQREVFRLQQRRNINRELIIERESKRLLAKVDAMTQEFLENTKDARESTRRAARADRESKGKPKEFGSWGKVDGASVLVDTEFGSRESAMLGSVQNAVQKTEEGTEATAVIDGSQTSLVLIIADEADDPIAKALIPAFSKQLQESFGDDLAVQVLKPSQTLPLGGNDAACLILFASSFKESPKKALERMLSKTIRPDGKIGEPPTQIVCVSSHGTERTNKFPYSVRNFVGGKLESRRRVEECVVSVVQNRMVEPPLDYTICKFGEFVTTSSSTAGDNNNGSKKKLSDWALMPGDVLDDPISLDTAAATLVQAVAFQPMARNASLCASGEASLDRITDDEWDDEFLRLSGPELKRFEEDILLKDGEVGKDRFDNLMFYLQEWGRYLASNKKNGLTTPIRAEFSSTEPNTNSVQLRGGVRLIFLPTNTGKRYLNRDEERKLRSKGQSIIIPLREKPGEGGVEILVELMRDSQRLRVRVRRCNMIDDTVIKEMSESTILNKVTKAIADWRDEREVESEEE